MTVFFGFSKEECQDMYGDRFDIHTKLGGIAFNLVDVQSSIGRSRYVFHGEGDGTGSYAGVTLGTAIVFGAHGHLGFSKRGVISGNYIGMSTLGKIAGFSMNVKRISGTSEGKTYLLPSRRKRAEPSKAKVIDLAIQICEAQAQSLEVASVQCEQTYEQFLLEAHKILSQQ